MAEFFEWLSSNSIAANILVISVGLLMISVILIFVIAFFQGRELTFWPPKVGLKPDKSKRNNLEKAEDENDVDSNQELVARMSSLERELIDIRAIFTFEEQIIVDVPRNVVKKISSLFSIRDNAVLENDRRKFLETQLEEEEIHYGSSRGYINTSKLTTSILKITPTKSRLNEDIDIDYVVLVREDYEHNNKYSHSAYLAYKITTTEDGLKIASLKNIVE